jgi:hypothetical protein
MARKHHTDPARKAAMIEAYRSGLSFVKVGQQFGVSWSTVRDYCIKANEPIRDNLKRIEPGTEFGNLTVVEHVRYSIWRCLCKCGNEEMADSSALRRGAHVRCAKCRVRPDTPPATQKCTGCGEVKPFTSEFFRKTPQAKYGLRVKCLECCRPIARKEGLKARRSLRLEVLTHYAGGKSPSCVCCGEATFEFLSLDHLEGSSRHDYKEHGRHFFSWLRRNNYPREMQVLCHNCNESLAHQGYCPHRPEITRSITQGDSRRKESLPEVPITYAGPRQTCIQCRELFPISADYFHRNKPMSTGFTTACKLCCNADRSLSGSLQRREQRMAVLKHYSNGTLQCACCGIGHHEFLTLDHVNENGREHRESIREPLYRFLFRNNFPADVALRVLCWSCNQARSWYRGCPHERAIITDKRDS